MICSRLKSVYLLQDRGSPPLNSTTDIRIIVLDSDDLNPRFTREVYRTQIAEFYPMTVSLLDKCRREHTNQSKVTLIKFNTSQCYCEQKALCLFKHSCLSTSGSTTSHSSPITQRGGVITSRVLISLLMLIIIIIYIDIIFCELRGNF